MQDRVAALDIHDLRELAGGASSLTYVGTLAGADTRRVVVKVAPAGLPPVRNRDVLRQACLLRALHPTRVPVPEVLWEDAGPALRSLVLQDAADARAMDRHLATERAPAPPGARRCDSQQPCDLRIRRK
ncbi:MAG TPA: phosphotransferase [Acidimicrobiia bacterium]